MKSLYETILSSTNTGKYQKITIDYILANGCKEKGSGTFYTYYVYHTGNILNVDDDGRIFYNMRDEGDKVKRLWVKTISDYDLLSKYFEKQKSMGRIGLSELRKQVLNKLEVI